MAYGIQNLRRSAIFDQLTPGSPAYGGGGGYDEQVGPSQQINYEPQDTRILGPDGRPLDSRDEEPTSSGLAKLANISVDPNKGDEQTRLKGYLDTIGGAYTPEYHSRNRNDNLLDNFPTRGQPSNWDRTAAALMSVGQKDPLAIQEQVLYAPYHRDAADFKLRADPFYKAAELENRQNINERTLVTNAASTFTAGERTNQMADAANQRYDLGQRKLQLEEFKARNPDLEFDFSGPNIMAVDPTGRKPPQNLGPTGKMSELDKIMLQGKNAREVAGIRAGATTDAARIRADASGGSGTGSGQYYRDSNGQNFRILNGRPVDIDGNPVRITGEFEKIRTDRETVDTASNSFTDLKNRQREIYDTNKYNARKYLTRNSDGTFTPKPRPEPGMWGGDVSAEQANYDQMMREMYPNYQSPSGGGPVQDDGAPQGKIPASTRQEKDARVASGEALYAVDSTGKIVGIVPNSPAGRAEAARLGYKVRGR